MLENVSSCESKLAGVGQLDTTSIGEAEPDPSGLVFCREHDSGALFIGKYRRPAKNAWHEFPDPFRCTGELRCVKKKPVYEEVVSLYISIATAAPRRNAMKHPNLSNSGPIVAKVHSD